MENILCENGIYYNEYIYLKQCGRKIIGTIVFRKKDGHITYRFSGTFQNSILNGTYVSKDPADFARGTILLRYSQKGNFIGHQSYFSRKTGEIISENYEWTKLN